MIVADQIRAARALLRWSARELAEKSGVSLPTIQRMEAATGVPSAMARSIVAITSALESAGIEFIDENGGGAGVRFKDPQ
ncbi:MAG: helix-turn-helix domain-containing protein [Alphaproteobacteria bacterium]|nr:helix-turn-helix domain-containing protein [Alphaproteobacteria bacterium]